MRYPLSMDSRTRTVYLHGLKFTKTLGYNRRMLECTTAENIVTIVRTKMRKLVSAHQFIIKKEDIENI